MKLAPALLACACGSSPVRTESPATVATACVVRDAAAKIEPMRLELRGKPFAQVDGVAAVTLELTPTRASLHVATANVEVHGDVERHRVRVRPRSTALIEGFYRIRRAYVKSVEGGEVELEPSFPTHLQPAQWRAPRFACGDLTLAEPPAHEVDGDSTLLKEGRRITVRREPAGDVVATIKTSGPYPKDDDQVYGIDVDVVLVEVLERNETAARIRTAPLDVEVEGWIDVAELDREPGAFGGLIGNEGGEVVPFEAVRCSREVPIYVRERDTKFRVGHVRANGVVRRARTPTPRGEIRVDLGAGDGELRPFAEAAELAACELTR